MKIDFHTHIYPVPVADKTVAAIRNRAGVEAYTDGTLEGLKKSMVAAGIDISVVAAVATRPEQVSSIQRWLSGVRQPGILTMAVTHPAVPLKREQMRDLKRNGFPGFKLHPDYQDFYADDARMFPFYEAAAEEGMFILFHAGMDRGLPYPVHATPKRLAAVHAAVPELRMVVAHLGGEGAYEETAAHLLGKDLYMDTSFVLRKIPEPFLERLLREHSPERLLFASDSPWTDQCEELRFFLKLPFLSGKEKEKIYFHNAARLLGLEKAGQVR